MSVNRGQLVGRRLKAVAVVMRLDELFAVGRRAAGGVMGGGSKGSPKCVRILRMSPGSVMKVICRPVTVEPHEDQWISPTVSILLIPTTAFFWERLGVEKDSAMGVLRNTITEAMKDKINEAPRYRKQDALRGRGGRRRQARPYRRPAEDAADRQDGCRRPSSHRERAHAGLGTALCQDMGRNGLV